MFAAKALLISFAPTRRGKPAAGHMAIFRGKPDDTVVLVDEGFVLYYDVFIVFLDWCFTLG